MKRLTGALLWKALHFSMRRLGLSAIMYHGNSGTIEAYEPVEMSYLRFIYHEKRTAPLVVVRKGAEGPQP